LAGATLVRYPERRSHLLRWAQAPTYKALRIGREFNGYVS